jgi:hypothetical protein
MGVMVHRSKMMSGASLTRLAASQCTGPQVSRRLLLICESYQFRSTAGRLGRTEYCIGAKHSCRRKWRSMSVESQRDTDIECSSQRMHVCAVCRTVSRSAEHGEGDDAQDRFHRSIVLPTELTSKRTSGRSADAEIWRCRGGTAERAERQIEARRSSRSFHDLRMKNAGLKKKRFFAKSLKDMQELRFSQLSWNVFCNNVLNV